VPTSRAEEFTAIVRDRMQSAVVMKVPLTVDVGVGDNWKDAKA
jgi:DNA polymerase I-like protein with 3'-5' exonuclease and polymerase domains